MKTQLKQGERPILVSKLHWCILILPVFILLASLLFSLYYGNEAWFVFLVAAFYLIFRIIERSNSTWALTDLRFIAESGAVSIESEESRLDAIASVTFHQSFLGKGLGFGKVKISLSDEKGSTSYSCVPKPGKMAEMIIRMQAEYRESLTKVQSERSGDSLRGNAQEYLKDVLVPVKSKWLVFIRIAARTSGLVFAVFSVLILLMDLFSNSFTMSYIIGRALPIAWFIGIVIAFRLEGLGGFIGLIAWVGIVISSYLESGSVHVGFLISGVPVLLYLLSWYLHRKYNKRISQCGFS